MDANQQPALGARLFREWCEANLGPIPIGLEEGSRFTLDDIYRKAVEFSTHTAIPVAHMDRHGVPRPLIEGEAPVHPLYDKPSGMKVQFIGEEQEPPL